MITSLYALDGPGQALATVGATKAETALLWFIPTSWFSKVSSQGARPPRLYPTATTAAITTRQFRNASPCGVVAPRHSGTIWDTRICDLSSSTFRLAVFVRPAGLMGHIFPAMESSEDSGQQVRTRDKSPNDLDAHHACDNESVTCEIMAALYCWRVGPLHNSLTMTIPSHSPPFSFVRTLGGMCSAIVTSPFGVVKTRLQSDLLRQKHAGVGAVVGDSVVLIRWAGGFLWHFVKTAHIIWLHPPFFPLFAPSRHSRTQHIIFWGMFFLTI